MSTSPWRSLEPLLTPLLVGGSTAPQRETILAVLNGVLGDYLAETRNPLAIEMSFRRDGQPSPLARGGLRQAFPEAQGKLLVLVHGSCMSDLAWNRKGAHHGETLALPSKRALMMDSDGTRRCSPVRDRIDPNHGREYSCWTVVRGGARDAMGFVLATPPRAGPPRDGALPGRSGAGMATTQTPFFRRLTSAHTARGGSKGPIFAVGHRVFVTCGNAQRSVTLTDSTGGTALGTLVDGAEVEILAWQPRGTGGDALPDSPGRGRC